MKQNQIKVVLCEPGQMAKEVIIENSLETLQEIVGGLVELYYLDERNAIICNDEGKLIGLPLNRSILDEEGKIVDVIAGTFVIVNADYDNEDFASLTDEDCEKYLQRFKFPEDIFLVGKEICAFKYGIPFAF